MNEPIRQMPELGSHSVNDLERSTTDDEILGLAGAAVRSDLLIGKEVRELRHARGWTLTELAKRIGVTGAQLHRYETGRTPIAPVRLTALAHALGVEVEDLGGPGSGNQDGPARSPTDSTDDLVALVDIYTRITDAKSRRAVLAIARILAGSQPVRDDE